MCESFSFSFLRTNSSKLATLHLLHNPNCHVLCEALSHSEAGKNKTARLHVSLVLSNVMLNQELIVMAKSFESTRNLTGGEYKQ
jgi:hypothetical protein